ncbi:MAG TPA: adenylate/guanylate cyclase domain-containing protein [Nitrososphaerales archaeon]|nr:adenylate/guanylate cyclase domain-containing protein [Nitrososphaerales archaeon]
MVQKQRRLAAVMFTDMVGYSALGQKDEALSLALVDEQRNLIRPILARHNGREVKTMGDAFMVEFPSALDAVQCAYDIQRAARESNLALPEDRRIVLRVGVHLGDVVESEGDISGDAVNIASRIEPLAKPGGICLSRQVYDQVHNKFDLPLSSMGEVSLKNVVAPVEVFSVSLPWGEQAAPAGNRLDRRRIAVLPFANMSPNSSDEYFADGMTEELIATMSRISGMKVIARTSVMAYKKTPKTINEVSRELEVGSVLEGSVRKFGDRTRVTVQLIDSQTSEHLWSESYDRDLSDILAIQTDISKMVANSLRVKLLDQEKTAMETTRTVNAQAYTLYLKGSYYWNERKKEDVFKAIKYFEESIKVDPQSALAYSGLANCYSILTNYGWMEPEAAAPKAREFASRAVELDDSLAEAHASLGNTLVEHSWDFARGEHELKRSVELRPNYAQAYHWLALISIYFRRPENSLSYQKKALEIDPHSRLVNMGMAVALASNSEYDQAKAWLERLSMEYPESATIKFWKSYVHLCLGESNSAVEEAKKAMALEGSTFIKLNLAWIYAETGKTGEARELVKEVEGGARDDYLRPSEIGLVRLALGETEEGFKLFERAVAEKDSAVLMMGGMPWYRKYTDLKGWKAIDSKIHLPK